MTNTANPTPSDEPDGRAPVPDPVHGGWRVAVFALAFGLAAHGCLFLATSLTVDPF